MILRWNAGSACLCLQLDDEKVQAFSLQANNCRNECNNNTPRLLIASAFGEKEEWLGRSRNLYFCLRVVLPRAQHQ